MKKIICASVLFLMSALMVCAQQYPAYIFLDGGGLPYPTGSGSAIPSNPPYAMCYTNISGQVQPCDFNGGGAPGPWLPLAGGTMTGPLNGTSASFSGAVAAGTVVLTGGSQNQLANTPITIPLGSATGGQSAVTINNLLPPGLSEVESNGTVNAVYVDTLNHAYCSSATDISGELYTKTLIPSLSGLNITSTGGVLYWGTYYLFGVVNGGAGGTANYINLYTASAICGPYTIGNGGNPVLPGSATTTNINYKIYNVSPMITSSGVSLFWEGGPSTNPDGGLGYTYAGPGGCTPSSCILTANANTTSFVATNFHSPQLSYFPDYSSIVMLVNDQNISSEQVTGRLEAYSISSSTPANLGTFSNWTWDLGFSMSFPSAGNALSDPRIVFSSYPGLKTWNFALTYDTNTGTQFQSEGSLTQDQWYRAVTNPQMNNVLPYMPLLTNYTQTWESRTNNTLTLNFYPGLTGPKYTTINWGYWNGFSPTVNYQWTNDGAGTFLIQDFLFGGYRLDFNVSGFTQLNSFGTRSVNINSGIYGGTAGTGGMTVGTGGTTQGVMDSFTASGAALGPSASVYGALTMSAMATPTNQTFSSALTGGSCLDSTAYYYRIAAFNSNGGTLASAETSITTGNSGANTNAITVKWNTVLGATQYKVYGRTTGAELLIATVGNNYTNSYVDTCTITPSGALPASNTSIGIATLGGVGQPSANYFSGSCTMAAGTLCSQALSKVIYNTPICVATVQGSAPIAAACSVTGNPLTVTVTAATSNSATWGFWVFGNPN